MSSLASTWVLHRAELDALVRTAQTSGIDEMWEVLLARPRVTLRWSGWVMIEALDFLRIRGVPLLSLPLRAEELALSEVTESTWLVITPDAHRHLDQFDPEAYTDSELEYLAEEGEASFEPTRDALAMLHDGVASLADDQILLLTVG